LAWQESGCPGRLAQVGTCEAAIDHLARARADNHLPAAILLDLNLPGCHGTELLEYLHQEQMTIPVAVLTSSANPRDRRRCEELHAAAYHVKPMSFLALIDLLRLIARQLLGADSC
jgi:CheY-like chemotaxis protein